MRTDLKIVKGDYFQVTLVFRPNMTGYLDTTGYDIIFKIRPSKYSEEVLFSWSNTNVSRNDSTGTISLHMTDVETALLDHSGAAVLNVWISDPQSNLAWMSREYSVEFVEL